MSMTNLNEVVAKTFMEVFNTCPKCGAKGKLHFIRDPWYSCTDDILGVECRNCSAKAVAAINKKHMYSVDSFERIETNLPASPDVSLIAKALLTLKMNPEEWHIDKEVIRKFAVFLYTNFNDISQLPGNSGLIGRK